MVARNFSEDGAVGANTNGTTTGTFGTPPAAFGTSSDSGSTPTTGFPMSGNDSSGFSTASFGRPAGPSVAGLAFEEGGAVPTDEDDDSDPNATDPQGSALGASLQRSINDAMKTVQDALSYGRQQHGLGGSGAGQQQASRMPMQPGNQSESGQPRQQPTPGPLPPTSNPFGKRADAEGAIDTEGGDQTAAMPSVPFSESQRPQPMPGPLPPTSNPFGKRGQQADAGDDAAPAIDTEEDA